MISLEVVVIFFSYWKPGKCFMLESCRALFSLLQNGSLACENERIITSFVVTVFSRSRRSSHFSLVLNVISTSTYISFGQSIDLNLYRPTYTIIFNVCLCNFNWDSIYLFLFLPIYFYSYISMYLFPSYLSIFILTYLCIYVSFLPIYFYSYISMYLCLSLCIYLSIYVCSFLCI